MFNDYGVFESNPISEGHHDRYDNAPEVFWTEKGLKITRLRLLSDPGFPYWDVSYCHGEVDGEPVVVQLPFDQIPKGRRFWKFLVAVGRKHGVYVKGVLDDEAISMLC
jgi:hypothetical protein